MDQLFNNYQTQTTKTNIKGNWTLTVLCRWDRASESSAFQLVQDDKWTV